MTDAEELAAALLHEGWEEPPRALVLAQDRWQIGEAREGLLGALQAPRKGLVAHATVDTIRLRNGAYVRFMTAATPAQIRGRNLDLVWWLGRERWDPHPGLILQVDIQMARNPLRGYDGPRRWG